MDYSCHGKSSYIGRLYNEKDINRDDRMTWLRNCWNIHYKIFGHAFVAATHIPYHGNCGNLTPRESWYYEKIIFMHKQIQVHGSIFLQLSYQTCICEPKNVRYSKDTEFSHFLE